VQIKAPNVVPLCTTAGARCSRPGSALAWVWLDALLGAGDAAWRWAVPVRLQGDIRRDQPVAAEVQYRLALISFSVNHCGLSMACASSNKVSGPLRQRPILENAGYLPGPDPG